MRILFVGFDSAWTDSESAPGAICAVTYDAGGFLRFRKPELVTFSGALQFIERQVSGHDVTLIAIDQPTIVKNETGMRPAEKVAASVVSWLGGGVQPANKSRLGMFDEQAPIWDFLRRLHATDDPKSARTAVSGRFIMEVFPALALASFDDQFCGRKRAPKYNPKSKMFRVSDFMNVVATARRAACKRGIEDAVHWCDALGAMSLEEMSGRDRKARQDELDALLCLLIAISWRIDPLEVCAMIGDLLSGYIVSPSNAAIRQRLKTAARNRSISIDGIVPI